MKFTSFKNWLFERATEKLSYGCLMLDTDIPDWKEKISIVDKDDVYEEDNDYGYEKEPHITILYGFHDDKINKKDLYEEIKKLHPITLTIDNISIFDDDNNYDVVKFDVPVTKELKEYRKIFLKFPNTQTFNKYHPHMTICYCIKGAGHKYVKKVQPFSVTFDTAIYSSPNEDKQIFDLK